MVKDHSESERKPAAGHWATLSDSQQGFFYMYLYERIDTSTYRIAGRNEHSDKLKHGILTNLSSLRCDVGEEFLADHGVVALLLQL